MLYLLDASSLIDFDKRFYGMHMVPPFWDWLQHQFKTGSAKMPWEMYKEVLKGFENRPDQSDPFQAWVKSNQQSIVLEEDVNLSAVDSVVRNGYTDRVDDVFTEKISKDPLIIAYALGRNDRCVVTSEKWDDRKIVPHKNKIPNLCTRINVQWAYTHTFVRKAGFRINWHPSE